MITKLKGCLLGVTDLEIIMLWILLGLVVLYWVYEKNKNDKNIENIELRVNVNGIRGKSTITRMITSILSEANIKTLGKTTGTAPRMILDQSEYEVEIVRPPRGVNIIEQLKVIDYASKHGYEALVCECMAVNPNYQRVYQEKMIQANVGVIVNVLEDHLDVMGPTLDEIALAFKSTIPYNGLLIISESPYVGYFSKIAKRRNTKVIVARESDIPEGYLNEFNYLVFPNNIAIPLAFAKAVGIDKEVALRGMLKANRDPGSITVANHDVDGIHSVFVNAFAANDPVSTVEIFDVITNEKLSERLSESPIVVINGRLDRVDRTEQFVDDCIPYLGEDIILVGIGEGLDVIEEAFQEKKLNNVRTFINYEGMPIGNVIEGINTIRNNKLIFCIGNIHGAGEILLEELNKVNPQINTLDLNLERLKV